VRAPFLLFLISICSISAFAQTHLVTSTLDDNSDGTLRKEISDAASGDTILFDPAINGDTIFLTMGQVDLSDSVTILGNGPELTIIDGSQDVGRNSRFFW